MSGHVTWGHGHMRYLGSWLDAGPRRKGKFMVGVWPKKAGTDTALLDDEDEPLVGMPEYGIVEGSWEHRQALELAEKMGQRGAPLTWDVRGQYSPEVRALAEELAR